MSQYDIREKKEIGPRYFVAISLDFHVFTQPRSTPTVIEVSLTSSTQRKRTATLPSPPSSFGQGGPVKRLIAPAAFD